MGRCGWSAGVACGGSCSRPTLEAVLRSLSSDPGGMRFAQIERAQLRVRVVSAPCTTPSHAASRFPRCAAAAHLRHQRLQRHYLHLPAAQDALRGGAVQGGYHTCLFILFSFCAPPCAGRAAQGGWIPSAHTPTHPSPTGNTNPRPLCARPRFLPLEFTAQWRAHMWRSTGKYAVGWCCTCTRMRCLCWRSSMPSAPQLPVLAAVPLASWRFS